MSEPIAESPSEMIVSTPGTCGGKPRVAGHRIRVQDIVIWTERMGMTVEEIVSSYPGMTREKIAAALDYYRTHREEIEQHLKEDEELADRLDREMKSALVRFAGKVDEQTVSTAPGREL